MAVRLRLFDGRVNFRHCDGERMVRIVDDILGGAHSLGLWLERERVPLSMADVWMVASVLRLAAIL